ncbi:MAG: S24 family peptidase [Eubacteriales bacterium]|nr:S24 family peptidase [Eubacteriales bacterium]
MFGDRLKDLRTQAGYTQQTMLDEVIQALINTGETPTEAKVSLGTYRNWEQNIAVPNSRYLKVIAPLLNTSTDYLLGITNDVTPHDLDYTAYGLLPVTKHKIPVLGTVAAGTPIFADEDLETYIDPEDENADFALHVKGNSMIGDGINDNDVVYVRKQRVVAQGEIAVVLVEDEATLKHVYKTNSEVQLVASNPSFAPIVVREDDGKEISILGKVVGIYKSLERGE